MLEAALSRNATALEGPSAFSGRSTWRFKPPCFRRALEQPFLDLGRSISLWVSALEILSHHASAMPDYLRSNPLLEGVTYCEAQGWARRYAAYIPGWRKNRNKKQNVKERRRSLPCWMYGELYQARNDFLHGNRVSVRTLSPKGSQDGLFWLAPYTLSTGI